jgi:hypothetical protein
MAQKHVDVRYFLIILCILLITACTLPQIGTKQQEATVEEETPDETMTAIYAIVESLTAQPSVTEVPPTSTAIPATETPIVTATTTFTNTPVASATLTATATKIPTAGITTVPARAMIFEAARLSTPPTLDGVWDEWTNTAYPMTYVVFGADNWTGADDLEGSFRVGWDNNYLYLAVKVKDDIYVQNASGADLYKGDGIELLLDANLQGDFYTTSLSPDDYQLDVSPGRPDTSGTKEAYLYFPSSLAGDKTSSVIIASVSQAGLYRMEAAIPWSLFNTSPSVGAKFGFALRASDNDNGGQNVQQSMVACIAGNSLANPTTWAELRLK